MDEFELLLDREKTALERFVRFRISPKEDADDVMQEIYLAACRNFNRLKNATIPFAFWIQTAAMFLPNSFWIKTEKPCSGAHSTAADSSVPKRRGANCCPKTNA